MPKVNEILSKNNNYMLLIVIYCALAGKNKFRNQQGFDFRLQIRHN
jgi:hypothetical protein